MMIDIGQSPLIQQQDGEYAKRTVAIVDGDGDVECIDVIIPAAYAEAIASINTGEISVTIILP